MERLRYKNPIDPATWPKGSFWLSFVGRFLFGILVTVSVFAAAFFAQPPDRQASMLAYWRTVEIEPGFRPEALLQTPLSVQAHVAGVAVAIIFSFLILALPKGTGLHRAFGWTWVLAMAVVAVTSVLMIGDSGGSISPLHIFTVITVVSLYGGLTGIRRGNVSQHAGGMVGLILGGLLIAGIFAFIPGRTMWRIFFSG